MEPALENVGSGSQERWFNSSYVSCIKMNGRPILPPLMTAARRKEMAAYREMAVALEIKRGWCRSGSVSSDGISNVACRSTPARPATLTFRQSGSKAKQTEVFRATLEQRLALDSESETESEVKRWSPLKVDSLIDLRLRVEGDSDSAQDTPGTVTASPRLVRQGSYTLPKPGPALQRSLDQSELGSQSLDQSERGSQYLEQSEPALLDESDLRDLLASQQMRSRSGRRTWNLQQARENWTSSRGLGSESDSSVPVTPARSRNSRSESLRSQRPRPSSVPSMDRVPSEPEPFRSWSSTVREQLVGLSDMMYSLAARHEQQQMEMKLMQEKQQKEMKAMQEKQDREMKQMQSAEYKKYEQIFKYKQHEILEYINTSLRTPPSLPTSLCVRDRCDDTASFISEPPRQVAVKSRPLLPSPRPVRVNGRSHEEAAQDTDIDLSMLEDSGPVEVLVAEVGDGSETWSMSSRASTISNEPATTAPLNPVSARFRTCSPPHLKLYNKAASVICAGARGFLTRRLMRTEPVSALRRSLRDSLQVCRTLKTANDLGSGDVKFMTSLQRQIFSDWDGLYDIFLKKSKAEQLAMISADRERLRRQLKSAPDTAGRRMSAATVKSLERKKQAMSTSLTLPPGNTRYKRSCFKMSVSLNGLPLPKHSPTCK